MEEYCKNIILLPGSGTDLVEGLKLKVGSYYAKDLKDAVAQAVKEAKTGDVVLFSPAFASFGMFTNEYDRNDQFMGIVKKLK